MLVTIRSTRFAGSRLEVCREEGADTENPGHGLVPSSNQPGTDNLESSFSIISEQQNCQVEGFDLPLHLP